MLGSRLRQTKQGFLTKLSTAMGLSEGNLVKSRTEDVDAMCEMFLRQGVALPHFERRLAQASVGNALSSGPAGRRIMDNLKEAVETMEQYILEAIRDHPASEKIINGRWVVEEGRRKRRRVEEVC